MKTSQFFPTRLLLAVALGAGLVCTATAPAATNSWDGGNTDIVADGNGISAGGAGTWNTMIKNWDVGAVAHTNWINANNDTAVFGGTAGTVTLGSSIDVGGLTFNTTGYVITNTGFSLNFAAANNTILFNNNIAAANITGPVGGAGNVSFTSANPAAPGTVTLNGTSAGGWSGTSTINAGMTVSLSVSNQALLNTSAIALNGGGITLINTTAGEAALNRVNNSATITSSGGTITFQNTSGATVYSETIGSVALNRGQLSIHETTNQGSTGSQTLTLSGLTQSGSAAVTFSSASGLNTNKNMIRVLGASGPGAGQNLPGGVIIGSWATTGTAADAQTDYAVYDASGLVLPANITASAETAWTIATNAYTTAAGGTVTLTGTRAITALRNIGATTVLTLASGANLETYGVLNGVSTLLTVAPGTGGDLTTPTGGGNLYLTTGSGGMTVSARIIDNGGSVTVVKSGSTGVLTLSGNNTFTGGLVVNSTGGNFTAVRLVGTQSFTGGVTLNGGAFGDGTDGISNAELNGNSITVNGAAAFIVTSGQALSSTSGILINPTGVLAIGPSAGSSMTVSGVVSGSGILDVSANNINSDSITVLANAANTFTGNVIYTSSHGNTRINELRVNSIGDAGKVVAGLVNSGNGNIQIFTLNSTASADLIFNIRQFELAGINKFDTSLRIGNNSAQAFTINTDLLATGTGTRTLQLQGTGAGTNTFAGKIANGNLTSLGLTKAESGTWILTGTNTYTGATAVNGGTLQIGTGGTVGAISSSSAISINTSTATFAFNRSDTLTQGTDFNSVISGSAGTLIQAGGGTLILNGANTFSGTTFANSGTIELTTPTTLQNSAIGTTGAGKFRLSGAATLTVGGLNGASGNLATIIASGYTGVITNLTLNPQSGLTWSYGGVIADATAGMTLTKIGAGIQQLSGSNTFTGGTILQAGTLHLAGNSASLGAARNDRDLTVTGTGTLEANNGVTYLLDALAVNNGATLNVFQSTGKIFTFNSTTSDSSAATIIHVGNVDSGRLDLGDASGFTGNLRAGWSAPGNGQITFTRLSDAGGVGNLQAGGTGANQTSTIRLTGDVGSLTFNNRKIEFLNNAVAGTLALDNSNTDQLKDWVINTDLVSGSSASARTLRLQGGNFGNNMFGGAISNTTGGGVLSVTKAGTGLWILGGTNTYSGLTTVADGLLVLARPIAKSSSTTVTTTTATASIGLGVGGSGYYSAANLDSLYAGTLSGFVFGNASSGVGIYTAAGDFTHGSNITGIRPLTKAGPDRLILSGNNTYSGATKISGGALEAQPGSGLSSNSYLQLDGGVLQANGFFVRTNSATVNGRNFQWATTGTGGGFAARGGKLTVRIGNTATTAQVWTNTLAAENGIRGTLKFGSATADSEVEFVNAINLNGGTRTIDVTAGTGGDFARLSGAISSSTGTGSLVKTGTGLLVLSAGNTYNGSTTVAGGTLLYNGTLALGTGAVTVNNGATLAGNGIINRPVNINAGGTLAPGTNSAGIFTVGNLTLASNATFAVQIGGNFLGDFDQLFVTGTATLSNSTLDVSFINAFVPTIGDIGNAYTIMDISGIDPAGIGTFAGLAEGAVFAAGGVNFSISYLAGDGNDILLTLTAIPEPGSLVLVGAGLGLLVILRRQRPSVVRK